MTKLTYILCFMLALASCGVQKEQNTAISPSEIVKVELYQGDPGRQIPMKEGATEAFLRDFNTLGAGEPTKYLSSYSFRIYHTDGKVDTLPTDGTIYFYNDNWYESKENLIQKYIDPVQAQLATAELLRSYMDQKNYGEALFLFSREQQANIRGFRDDPAKFAMWCDAWTFDDAKFDRYTALIRSGKAPFSYEGNSWKINER